MLSNNNSLHSDWTFFFLCIIYQHFLNQSIGNTSAIQEYWICLNLSEGNWSLWQMCLIFWMNEKASHTSGLMDTSQALYLNSCGEMSVQCECMDAFSIAGRWSFSCCVSSIQSAHRLQCLVVAYMVLPHRIDVSNFSRLKVLATSSRNTNIG